MLGVEITLWKNIVRHEYVPTTNGIQYIHGIINVPKGVVHGI